MIDPSFWLLAYILGGIITTVWVHLSYPIIYLDFKHRLLSIGLCILIWPYALYNTIRRDW